jgi:hypothetical protein
MEETWVRKIPGDKWAGARKVKPVHQATELGRFGFRHWTVQLPNGETGNYSGAGWDPEKKVWWGWDEASQVEYVVYWDGPEPPATIVAKCPNCGADTGTSEGENGKCPNCGHKL